MTAGPQPPAALLLDLDGTLVLSEPVHRRTWERFFATWDVEVDEREYERTYMGRRAGDVLASAPGPWTGTDLTAAVRAMTEHALRIGADADVVPGAADLVRSAAAADVPVAVVTSAGAPWAERVLGQALQVRELVRVLVTAEQVRVGKPSPEGYLRACALLGVDPPRAVGVEDSPSGLAALAAAGVGRLVGVTTTADARQLRAAGAQLVVPDLAAAPLRALVGRGRPPACGRTSRADGREATLSSPRDGEPDATGRSAG